MILHRPSTHGLGLDRVRLPNASAPGAQASQQEAPAKSRGRDVLYAIDVSLNEKVYGVVDMGRGLPWRQEAPVAGLVSWVEQGEADDGDLPRINACCHRHRL